MEHVGLMWRQIDMRRKKILIAVICILVFVGIGAVAMSRNILKDDAAKVSTQDLNAEPLGGEEEYTV